MKKEIENETYLKPVRRRRYKISRNIFSWLKLAKDITEIESVIEYHLN